MYSEIVPFEDIISALKDNTGISNMRNMYPQIRRLINRIQKEIGRGPTMILKRKTYSVANGLIQNKKIKLPEDMIDLESFGMCKEGLCPNDYIIQGNYAFLCRNIDKFSLIYYALLCDGTGNPVIVENHLEAVVHGIMYFMYKSKMWNNEGNFNFYKDLERYYEDRIGEARGNDLMPSTQQEWAQISSLWNMSLKDYMMYNVLERCYCCVPEINNETMTTNPDNQNTIYYFQFSDTSLDINYASEIDEAFLLLANSESFFTFSQGYIVEYNTIGRTGFAYYSETSNKYKIFDVFNNDITNVVFESYYNEELKLQILISKEISSFANIYYKFI